MRGLVLILMIALLPLRLWAAEGMSVRMALGDARPSTSAASMEAMPDDCPMMAKAATGSEDGEESAQASGHCFACQLNAASAPSVVASVARGPAPAGPPAWSAARFASADPRRDLRPPIS